MSRYGQAIGIWEISVGGANLRVKPRTGDNLELMNIFKRNQGNEAQFSKDIFDFLVKIISRDEVPQNDQEKDELNQYVEFNLNELIRELMIKFKWTTPEAMKQMESDVLKKLEA